GTPSRSGAIVSERPPDVVEVVQGQPERVGSCAPTWRWILDQPAPSGSPRFGNRPEELWNERPPIRAHEPSAPHEGRPLGSGAKSEPRATRDVSECWRVPRREQQPAREGEPAAPPDRVRRVDGTLRAGRRGDCAVDHQGRDPDPETASPIEP